MRAYVRISTVEISYGRRLGDLMKGSRDEFSGLGRTDDIDDTSPRSCKTSSLTASASRYRTSAYNLPR